MTFTIISFTTDLAFNFFASLGAWLLIISSPMFLVMGLFKYVRKVLQ